MFFILLGLILYNAIIFGEMTLLVGETTKKESEFQKEVDVANTAMKNMDLPSEAKQDVRDYIITTQGTKYESDQLKQFLDMLNPSLKEKVSIEIFTSTIKKNLPLRTAIKSLVQQKFSNARTA